MMSLSHAHTLLYAMLCGSLCFVVAFMYQRNGAKYKWFPSLTAFCIAAVAGAEWIEVMGSIILYKQWPSISPVFTICLFLLLILSIKERGNVARVIDRLMFVRATN
jgi:Protein of unknown function (DUF754).